MENKESTSDGDYDKDPADKTEVTTSAVPPDGKAVNQSLPRFVIPRDDPFLQVDIAKPLTPEQIREAGETIKPFVPSAGDQIIDVIVDKAINDRKELEEIEKAGAPFEPSPTPPGGGGGAGEQRPGTPGAPSSANDSGNAGGIKPKLPPNVKEDEK